MTHRIQIKHQLPGKSRLIFVLSRNPELLQTYGRIINDQLERGFIEKIPDSTPTSNSHYIPHHAV